MGSTTKPNFPNLRVRGLLDLFGKAEYKRAEVTLTATQIKALNTTPVELVPVPATGHILVIDHIVGLATYAGAAFTGSNALEIRETNGSGTKLAGDFPATGFINIASGTAMFDSKGTSALRTTSNVVAYVPTANPGGASATGTIKLAVYYRDVTV